jgi:hypothetical protein
MAREKYYVRRKPNIEIDKGRGLERNEKPKKWYKTKHGIGISDGFKSESVGRRAREERKKRKKVLAKLRKEKCGQ